MDHYCYHYYYFIIIIIIIIIIIMIFIIIIIIIIIVIIISISISIIINEHRHDTCKIFPCAQAVSTNYFDMCTHMCLDVRLDVRAYKIPGVQGAGKAHEDMACMAISFQLRPIYLWPI